MIVKKKKASKLLASSAGPSRNMELQQEMRASIMANEGDGSGRTGELQTRLRKRITLATTTMERNMQNERAKKNND